MNTTPIIFEPNVEGVMRDGVVLRADVWRPDKPGRFPVLLTRTPYDKTHPRISMTASLDPRRVVPQDYVMIFQDTRGRFASDGDPSDIARSNFQDGYDSVEWAAGLPYSDGNVGMFGISFMALTQWMAALAHPPHLRTIFPQQFGDDRLQYPGRSIGLAFNLSWIIAQSIDTLNKRAAAGEDVSALRRDAEAALDDLRDGLRGRAVARRTAVHPPGLPALRRVARQLRGGRAPAGPDVAHHRRRPAGVQPRRLVRPVVPQRHRELQRAARRRRRRPRTAASRSSSSARGDTASSTTTRATCRSG